MPVYCFTFIEVKILSVRAWVPVYCFTFIEVKILFVRAWVPVDYPIKNNVQDASIDWFLYHRNIGVNLNKYQRVFQ